MSFVMKGYSDPGFLRIDRERLADKAASRWLSG